MILRNLLLMLAAVTLTACGGGDSQTYNTDSWQRIEVYYSYPYDGQHAVSPRSPVVLRFSQPVSVDASNFSLYQCAAGASRCDGDSKVASVALNAPQTVDGGRGVVLSVQHGPLQTGTTYSLVLNHMETPQGSPAFPAGSLAFRTRLADAGPASRQQLAPRLQVETVTPDGEARPFMDFSTVDVRFNQRLDRDSVRYGDTDKGASVELESSGETVPAILLVQGTALVVDPKADLTPGQRYTLKLAPSIQGVAGAALQGGLQKSWTAQDSTPRSTLVQRAAPADDCMSPSSASTSMLTGQAINCVPVIAKLLGNTTVSRQSGDVYAQLAFAPHYPQVTPLRIPKGSLLKGDPLAVMIGGQVDAGFDSGAVTVTFLSDATGYLIPNPYSSSDSAPKQLRLTMDVAFNTRDPRANGAFNQNLLQVELVGTATTDTRKGSLVVDAIGVVEPRVLGSETAYGVLSFHMESYPDQNSAPPQPQDLTGPTLQAWQPGQYVDKQRPGDPIMLNFSEPLAADSVMPGKTLTLTSAGVAVPFHWYLDGVSVVMKPQTPLAYGADYQVQFTDGLTDLAGNPAQPQTLDFTMPSYSADAPRAPVVLTAYPGFPCIAVEGNLAQDDAGRCEGGKSSDDHLPLPHLPANRPIVVSFSQVMDPASINADTFVVEPVDSSGSVTGSAVAGDLQVSGRKVTFTPAQPWTPGALYRYTLRSVPDSPACGSDAICSGQATPLPLQTRLLAQTPDAAPSATQGGPDLPIYFRAAAASANVLQQLRNLPTADVNANFLIDAGEDRVSGNPQAVRNSARAIANPDNNPDADGTAAKGSGVKDANVGCAVGSSCPDQKYIYLSGNLNVDIAGFVPADQIDQGDDSIPAQVKQQGGVLVYIYPTRLVTSNLVVYTQLPDLLTPIANAPPASTGPQLMRIRYRCDAAKGNCTAPDYGRVKGWIVNGDNGPQFLTKLDLYLDSPKLSPKVYTLGIETTLTHNQHSYPLSLSLAGDVSFLDDGRLQIEQISQNPLDINVVLGNLPLGLTGTVYVSIPPGDTFLNYLSEPIKP
ncbi:MAG: Ig-like domain-containing protein [Alcanivorax sp.]|nr:Ig-like domain-containing protein [Alcanivorax sp.]